jgi:hypothetical protein
MTIAGVSLVARCNRELTDVESVIAEYSQRHNSPFEAFDRRKCAPISCHSRRPVN